MIGLRIFQQYTASHLRLKIQKYLMHPHSKIVSNVTCKRTETVHAKESVLESLPFAPTRSSDGKNRMCHLRNSMHHTGVLYYELYIFAVACLSLVACFEYVTIFRLGKKHFTILKLPFCSLSEILPCMLNRMFVPNHTVKCVPSVTLGRHSERHQVPLQVSVSSVS